VKTPAHTSEEFDGCSGFISFFYYVLSGGPPPCEGCCHRHDDLYRTGGPLWKKFKADVLFAVCEYRCQRERRGRVMAFLIAALMFLGVTFGGVPWVPFPSVRRVEGRWRWQWTGVRWGWTKTFPQYREGSYAVALLEFAAFVSAVGGGIYVIL
jgi:hypothetical protein